jgi:hypothetical protein
MATITSWDWRTRQLDVEEAAANGSPATVSTLGARTHTDALDEPADSRPASVEARPHLVDLLPPPPIDTRPEPVDNVPPSPVDVRPEPVDAPPPPPVDVRPEPVVDVPPPPPPLDLRPEPVDAPPPPFDVRPEPVPAAAATQTGDPTVVHGAAVPPVVALEQHPAAAPVTAFGPEDPDANLSSEPLPWPEPVAEPAAKQGLLRRLWAHRWTKAGVLCLVSLAAVLLIIWSIRLAHNPGSSSGTPTTVAQSASGHGGATTPPTSFVSPVTPAQLARYKLYAAPFQQANVTASKAFASAGSTPTTAQLAAAVAAYHYAVNLYDFQLRFIQWPTAMQASIDDDHAQLEALVSFLASFTTVSPTNMSGWLSGLHIRTTAAETTDNLVRRDLDLPGSNTYPT